MSTRTGTRLATMALLALSAFACSEAPPGPEQLTLPNLHREQLPASVIQQLDALRNSLLQYQAFDVAENAGFDIELTPCMEMRGKGGMGYHYGNSLLIDAVPDEMAPEALLYQPTPKGMQLVGVEFIVPFDQWTGSQPPVLFNQVMRPNYNFGLWTLHAWLFKENPKGVFADWNPRVHC
ncbi:MAG TPA: hypothetical protein VK922_13430 [Gemmatimonadaceae bacterium]|nr:hypothetical protein [Gemmatimonadaceae bacterium]